MQINLLARRHSSVTRNLSLINPMLFIVSLVFLLMYGLWWSYYWHQTNVLKKCRLLLQQELFMQNQSLLKLQTLNKDIQRTQFANHFLVSLKKEATFNLQFLEKIEKQLPAEILLTQLEMNRSSILIVGECSSVTLVEKFIQICKLANLLELKKISQDFVQFKIEIFL